MLTISMSGAIEISLLLSSMEALDNKQFSASLYSIKLIVAGRHQHQH